MDREDVDKEWIKKLYIYNWMLLSYKKKWHSAICSNMDRPREYHAYWNVSQRKINIACYYLYVESKN